MKTELRAVVLACHEDVLVFRCELAMVQVCWVADFYVLGNQFLKTLEKLRMSATVR